MIIDTSVLYEALVPGPETDHARSVVASVEVRFAPDLILFEIAGALTRAVRRRVITAAFAREAYHSAPSLVSAREPPWALLGRALEMSLEIPHPVGDCVFLALAEAKAMTMITIDRRFARKVAASPYGRLVVELSSWSPA